MNALLEQVAQKATVASQSSHVLLVSLPKVPSGHIATQVVSLRNSKPSLEQVVHISLSVSLQLAHGVPQNSHSFVAEL